MASDFKYSIDTSALVHAYQRRIEQPVVWKFCSGVIMHPGIPT